ncbi:MAG: hypothetical protein U0625_03280 [Phycisphaerales bacterium]
MLRALLPALALLLAAATTVAAPPSEPVPAWRKAKQVAVIPLRGPIDEVSRASLERRLARAQRDGADAVVLELDTPGGDAGATLEMCMALKERAPRLTWAWVHPSAYSAGTILALACRGIVVSPNAAFGDAAPIAAIPGLGLQPLPPAERAKLEAPILAEVVDSARRNHYDETLVRAFISAPDEVWLLERAETGERICVGRQEYRDAFGTDPPTMRSAPGAAREADAWQGTVLPRVDLTFRRGGSQATNEQERDKEVEFLQVRPPVRAPLTSADAPHWRVVSQIDGADELLVVYAPEARALGLADAVIADDKELGAYFGGVPVIRYEEHAGDGIVRFLTSWPVRLFLVVVLLVGFFVEIAAPGIGWFGGAAAVALALLLGAPLMAGLSSWWPLLLVLLGAALVVVEVTLIPGIGIVGFLGAACIVIGLVAGFVTAPISSAEGQSDLARAVLVVVVGGIISALAAWGILRALPRTRLGGAAVLHATVGEGGAAAERAALRALPAVGSIGAAITPLRPVGKASFDGRIVEVQAIGPFIDADRRVVVRRSSTYAVEVEEAS